MLLLKCYRKNGIHCRKLRILNVTLLHNKMPDLIKHGGQSVHVKRCRENVWNSKWLKKNLIKKVTIKTLCGAILTGIQCTKLEMKHLIATTAHFLFCKWWVKTLLIHTSPSTWHPSTSWFQFPLSMQMCIFLYHLCSLSAQHVQGSTVHNQQTNK